MDGHKHAAAWVALVGLKPARLECTVHQVGGEHPNHNVGILVVERDEHGDPEVLIAGHAPLEACQHQLGGNEQEDDGVVASGTARRWGCTVQGLSILHETPTFVEYTHLSASSTPPSCSTRGCENDRLTATARTGDGPIDCQIDDGNNVAQTGGPIYGACRDGCRQGWLTGGAESPQRAQPPRRYRDPSENRMIPRAAHQPHQPWSRHVRCTDTKPLTREAEEVCPASSLAGQTFEVVELGGFEPPTFSLRTRRATNCAIAPSADRS